MLDTRSDRFKLLQEQLSRNENILLSTLGFDCSIDHPHTHVVRCCQLIHASRDLAQTSYFMATNSLHLTTMCLQYKPTLIACACIHLVYRWSSLQIPRSSEGRQWFSYVDEHITLEQLDSVSEEFLLNFNQSSSKLKRKIMQSSRAVSDQEAESRRQRRMGNEGTVSGNIACTSSLSSSGTFPPSHSRAARASSQTDTLSAAVTSAGSSHPPPQHAVIRSEGATSHGAARQAGQHAARDMAAPHAGTHARPASSVQQQRPAPDPVSTHSQTAGCGASGTVSAAAREPSRPLKQEAARTHVTTHAHVAPRHPQHRAVDSARAVSQQQSAHNRQSFTAATTDGRHHIPPHHSSTGAARSSQADLRHHTDNTLHNYSVAVTSHRNDVNVTTVSVSHNTPMASQHGLVAKSHHSGSAPHRIGSRTEHGATSHQAASGLSNHDANSTAHRGVIASSQHSTAMKPHHGKPYHAAPITSHNGPSMTSHHNLATSSHHSTMLKPHHGAITKPHQNLSMTSHHSSSMTSHHSSSMTSHHISSMTSHHGRTFTSHHSSSMASHHSSSMTSHHGSAITSHHSSSMTSHHGSAITSHHSSSMTSHHGSAITSHHSSSMTSHHGSSITSHHSQSLKPHHSPSITSHHGLSITSHHGPVMKPHHSQPMKPHYSSSITSHHDQAMPSHHNTLSKSYHSSSVSSQHSTIVKSEPDASMSHVTITAPHHSVLVTSHHGISVTSHHSSVTKSHDTVAVTASHHGTVVRPQGPVVDPYHRPSSHHHRDTSTMLDHGAKSTRQHSERVPTPHKTTADILHTDVSPSVHHSKDFYLRPHIVSSASSNLAPVKSLPKSSPSLFSPRCAPNSVTQHTNALNSHPLTHNTPRCISSSSRLATPVPSGESQSRLSVQSFTTAATAAAVTTVSCVQDSASTCVKSGVTPLSVKQSIFSPPAQTLPPGVRSGTPLSIPARSVCTSSQVTAKQSAAFYSSASMRPSAAIKLTKIDDVSVFSPLKLGASSIRLSATTGSNYSDIVSCGPGAHSFHTVSHTASAHVKCDPDTSDMCVAGSSATAAPAEHGVTPGAEVLHKHSKKKSKKHKHRTHADTRHLVTDAAGDSEGAQQQADCGGLPAGDTRAHKRSHKHHKQHKRKHHKQSPHVLSPSRAVDSPGASTASSLRITISKDRLVNTCGWETQGGGGGEPTPAPCPALKIRIGKDKILSTHVQPAVSIASGRKRCFSPETGASSVAAKHSRHCSSSVDYCSEEDPLSDDLEF